MKIYAIQACKECDSTEVGEQSAGDESWTICRSCQSVEQGTYAVYEDDHGERYTEAQWAEAQFAEVEFANQEDEDPTPYCTWCGAKSRKDCKCPDRAEND